MRGGHNEKTKRNKYVYDLYKRGFSLSEIHQKLWFVKDNYISTQRISQIIHDYHKKYVEKKD